jgi:hypothetical protein
MAQHQKSTAQSSMDSEIIAANEGAKEAAWLEKVIDDLGERERGSNPYIPTLYCDNLGGIDLIKDTKFYNKAKHIEIRYFFIWNDMVQRDRLRVQAIESKEQVANALIKQLPIDSHWKFARMMGISNPIKD